MLCDTWYLPRSYIEQVRVRASVEKAHLVIELDPHIHLTSTFSLYIQGDKTQWSSWSFCETPPRVGQRMDLSF